MCGWLGWEKKDFFKVFTLLWGKDEKRRLKKKKKESSKKEGKTDALLVSSGEKQLIM